MRVDTLDLEGLLVKYIGDVHLGRRFMNGVPLHRRGEREAGVLKQFEDELLNVGGARVVVQVGDIFEKFSVSNDVEMEAYEAIKAGTEANPNVQFIFNRGNHDASKDLEKVSSFDILRGLCEHLINVDFVVDKPLAQGRIACLPWHPVVTAAEMAASLPQDATFLAVFGHYDLESYGGDTHNLIPIEQLKAVTSLVITGHDHKPRTLEMDGVKVVVTGSLAPYAHGEEAADEADPMYVTLTLGELEQCLQST